MFGLTAVPGASTWRLAMLAATMALSFLMAVPAAQAETRTLKFYNLHTRERASFDYKRNGRYDQGELKKINWFMRDWRKGKEVTMDPKLLDLVWEAYRQSGSRDYIHVICGYRSPATNSMLRRTRGGQAQKSQHMVGKALDFYIPDVPLAKLRAIGLKMQVGGVGYYPKSGSPFVHFDTGNARHWPRMSRKQLLAVFPNGNTVHVPSDGKPLPGYQQALASYKSRRSSSSLEVANASGGSSGGGKTLLAMLFGDGGADEAEDEAEIATSPARSAPAARQPQAPVVASVVPTSRPTPGAIPQPTVAMLDAGFDTRSDPRNAPAAAVNAASAEPATVIAALAPSEIPLPRWAPGRAVPATIEAPVEASEPSQDEVATMVAALESESPSVNETAAGELAYAVPTPRQRPPFATVLNSEAVAAAVPEKLPTRPAKQAETQAALTTVAAVAPSARPERVRKAEAKEPVVRQSSETARTIAAIAAAASSEEDAAMAADLSGKGGRVIRVADSLPPAPRKPVATKSQDEIAARFEAVAFFGEAAN
ncbi:MAG: DUF882 domain-containing protein [Pseudomonadota bacterium]|nr:DUF882 domain-containing protein [Pseudomonadota bacterium]